MNGSFDLSLVLGVQRVMMSTPWTMQLAIFFARWLIIAEAVMAAGLYLFPDRQKRHAVFEAAWSAGGALAITSILSHLILRVRPFLASPDVVLLIPPPLNTSFPSGHTATAVAIACAVLFGSRTAGLVAFVMAAFIAFGRVSVGVHFPTDILGGVFVGLVSFGIVRFVHASLRRTDITRSAAQHHHS